MKRFWNWCKRHVLLVTVAAMVCLAFFAVVNIEILHMTSEPEFCAMCHPGQGFGPLAEVDSWEHSGHAKSGVSCLDCHGRPGMFGYLKAKIGGLKDTYMQFTISSEEKLHILSNPKEDLVPSETCLFCHSDEGNTGYRQANSLAMALLDMRLSDSVENPQFRQRKGLPDILRETFVGGTKFDHSFHMESFDLNCRDCHFGVVHRQQSKTDRMNMCLVCHTENEGSSAPQMADCRSCHEAQLAMNEGRGALGIPEEPSMMFEAKVDCQMCHSGVSRGIFRPSSSTCVDCHDDAYADIFDMWSTDTREQLKKVEELRRDTESALKRAEEVHRDVSAEWEIFIKALANIRLVKNDGTFGIHNPDYAQAALSSAENDLKAILAELNRNW